MAFGVWLSCIALPLTARADALAGRNNPYGKLTMDWKTAATDWGEGLPAFPVIAVMTTWTSREAVELMERLPVKVIPIQAAYNTVFFREANQYLDLSKTEASRVASQASLSPADVILVGRVAWGTFPFEVRYNLLKKVKDGAGMVVVNPVEPLDELAKILAGQEVRGDEKFLTSGILGPDLKPLSLSSGKPEITMFSFGKGRVLLVRYPDEPVYAPNDGVRTYQPFTTTSGYDHLFSDESLVRYDCQVAALARQVLWAARFKPSASIENVETAEDGARIILSGSYGGKKLWVRVRDAAGRVCLEKDYEADSTVKVSFPKGLPAGNLFLDARLPGCGWYSTAFSLTPEVACTLSCQPEQASAGDQVQVKAVVAAGPPAATASLSVYDIHGDMVAGLQTAKVTGPECAFSFSIPPDVRSNVLRLEVALWEGEQVRGRSRLNLPVRRPFAYDDFYLQAWGGSSLPSHLARQMLESVADAGVDFIYFALAYCDFRKQNLPEVNSIGALRAAECGMKTVPYSTYFAYHGNSNERSPSLYDPAYRSQVKDSLRKVTAAFAPYGPPWYSLGDECCLSASAEVCFSETTRAEFEKYLKKKYRDDLSAVNAAWGAQMKGWNEARGIRKEEAVKKGEFGQWLDFRMFMYQSFSDFIAYAADSIRSVDATARVGNEGTPGTSYISGYRWDTILRGYGGFFPYTNPGEEEVIRVARSFMKPDTIRGGIFGSYSYESEYKDLMQSDVSQEELYDRLVRYQVWFYMAQNMNAAFWWTLFADAGSPGPSGMSPDLTPLPFFQAAIQETDFLKSGVAKLLLNHTWTDDRVAMLYSPFSTIMNDATENISWGESTREFCNLLEHAGIQYTFISEDDLAAGKLTRARFDFLVAPACVCLDDSAVKAIRDFCGAGGKMVADLYPGARAANGRLRNPLPFETEFSAGKLCLYPAIDGQYRFQAGDENGRLKLIHFKEFLAKAGMESWYGLATPEGLPAKAVMGATFQGDRDIRYLLLLPGMLAPAQQNLVLTIPARMVGTTKVYDLRTGKILPVKKDGVLRITLKAGTGEILGFLPYRVKSLSWSSDRKEYLPGNVLTGTVALAADAGSPGFHVVSLRIFQPDGKEAAQYFTKIPVRNGKGAVSISIPHNAPPGRWKCNAREVTSGKNASGQFLVKPEEDR
ncbi:MAG: beta-galactosidase [Verrucomicrobia bacterium]|nr:beta-galactosidase [Verrucomicrobiota bacterium]